MPGSPDKLVLESKLTKVTRFTLLAARTSSSSCSIVNGARAGATLISNPTPDTTKNGEVSLSLPANSRKVQLRLGPQAKPYAAFDVDLAGQSVVKR